MAIFNLILKKPTIPEAIENTPTNAIITVYNISIQVPCKRRAGPQKNI